MAHHESHDVFLYVNGIGHAIVAFDEAAVFLVGIVVDDAAGNAFWGVVVKNLLQRGHADEGGIGVFAQDDDFGKAASVLQAEEVLVVFVLQRKDIATEFQGGGFCVGLVTRIVDTYEDVDEAL
mgnify:CR=1 FL=1